MNTAVPPRTPADSTNEPSWDDSAPARLAAALVSLPGTPDGSWQGTEDSLRFDDTALDTREMAADELSEALDSLVDLGRRAAALREHLRAQRQAQAELTRAEAEAAREARYRTLTPEMLSLPPGTTAAGTATLPAPPVVPGPYEHELTGPGWLVPTGTGHVRVLAAARKSSMWHRSPLAVLLVTTDDLVPLGIVEVDANEAVSSRGAYVGASVPDVLGSARRAEVQRTDPWPQVLLPEAGASVGEHVAALAGAAPAVREWVQGRMDDDARAAQVARERAAQAREWAALSRSKQRIPTAALNAWLRAESFVDYDSTGYATGGVRVVSKMLAGRTRPAHLDGQRRGAKPVGVAEVLWVARLEHESVVRRRDNARTSHRFYAGQVDRLREALPGLVVKVPEDGRAIFVAVDEPEYVQALDAALVEWVLLGDVED